MGGYPHGIPPLMVNTALRMLDVQLAAALLVGDTFAEDVGAAHAAGIDATWIDRGAQGVPPGAAAPRYVLRALPEVSEALG
jgi:FMN phosphatase YigB (HAD superfamily)